jgi:flavin-dependent dehydrogenase
MMTRLERAAMIAYCAATAIGAMLTIAPPACAAERDAEAPYDVVVYGATSGGVMAAIQSARMGKLVVLIEPGRHVGGMTSGGLGATDIGNKRAIGGLSRTFYERIGAYYRQESAWVYEKRADLIHTDERAQWVFEPRVAELEYRTMLDEAQVEVLLGERLDRQGGLETAGANSRGADG